MAPVCQNLPKPHANYKVTISSILIYLFADIWGLIKYMRNGWKAAPSIRTPWRVTTHSRNKPQQAQPLRPRPGYRREVIFLVILCNMNHHWAMCLLCHLCCLPSQDFLNSQNFVYFWLLHPWLFSTLCCHGFYYRYFVLKVSWPNSSFTIITYDTVLMVCILDVFFDGPLMTAEESVVD